MSGVECGAVPGPAPSHLALQQSNNDTFQHRKWRNNLFSNAAPRAEAHDTQHSLVSVNPVMPTANWPLKTKLQECWCIHWLETMASTWPFPSSEHFYEDVESYKNDIDDTQISVWGERGIAGISAQRPPAGKEMCLSLHSLIHKHARNISIKLVSCFQTMGTFPFYFITSFSPICGIDQRKSALRTIEFETFKTKTLEYYLFRKTQS